MYGSISNPIRSFNKALIWQYTVYAGCHIMLVSLRWTPDMLRKLQNKGTKRIAALGGFSTASGPESSTRETRTRRKPRTRKRRMIGMYDFYV